MADDPIAALAVGVAADHQEEKRRRSRKAGATTESATETQADDTPPTINDPELRAATESLGDAVEDRDADEDRATDFMVDRLVSIAQTAELDRGTLVGDVRDTLLDLFKANPKPWSQLLEDQQRRIADALETSAKALIRSIVVIVAEDNEEGAAIHAKLESYAEKGGLKIALTANGDRETVLALHDAVGQQVVVKRADSTRYGGQRREAGVQPDQPGLGFEADSDRQAADPFAGPAGDEDLVAAAEDLDTDKDPEA